MRKGTEIGPVSETLFVTSNAVLQWSFDRASVVGQVSVTHSALRPRPLRRRRPKMSSTWNLVISNVALTPKVTRFVGRPSLSRGSSRSSCASVGLRRPTLSPSRTGPMKNRFPQCGFVRFLLPSVHSNVNVVGVEVRPRLCLLCVARPMAPGGGDPVCCSDAAIG